MKVYPHSPPTSSSACLVVSVLLLPTPPLSQSLSLGNLSQHNRTHSYADVSVLFEGRPSGGVGVSLWFSVGASGRGFAYTFHGGSYFQCLRFFILLTDQRFWLYRADLVCLHTCSTLLLHVYRCVTFIRVLEILSWWTELRRGESGSCMHVSLEFFQRYHA